MIFLKPAHVVKKSPKPMNMYSVISQYVSSLTVSHGSWYGPSSKCPLQGKGSRAILGHQHHVPFSARFWKMFQTSTSNVLKNRYNIYIYICIYIRLSAFKWACTFSKLASESERLQFGGTWLSSFGCFKLIYLIWIYQLCKQNNSFTKKLKTRDF